MFLRPAAPNLIALFCTLPWHTAWAHAWYQAKH